MNNSIWVALAGWCLVIVQLVLNIFEVPIVITHLLTVIIMLDFGLAIIIAVRAIIFAVQELRVSKKRLEEK